MTASEEIVNNNVSPKFNSGLFKVQRLHDCRVNIRLSRFEKRYDLLYASLLSYWAELDYKMTDDERKMAGLYIERIKEAYKGKITQNVYAGNTRIMYGPYIELMYALELFLASVEHRMGLGMVDKKDRRFAIGH